MKWFSNVLGGVIVAIGLIGCGGGSSDNNLPSQDDMVKLTKANSESKAIEATVTGSAGSLIVYYYTTLVKEAVDNDVVNCDSGDGNIVKDGNKYKITLNNCKADGKIYNGKIDVVVDSNDDQNQTYNNFEIKKEGEYDVKITKGSFLYDADEVEFKGDNLEIYIKINDKESYYLDYKFVYNKNEKNFNISGYVKSTCLGKWIKIDKYILDTDDKTIEANYSSLNKTIRLNTSPSGNIILTNIDDTTKDLGSYSDFENKLEHSECIIGG